MKQKQEIPVLVAEINGELDRLQKVVDSLPDRKNAETGLEYIESTALRLHNFYTGCERIFKYITSEVNGALPDTWDWHRRLLHQMTLSLAYAPRY